MTGGNLSNTNTPSTSITIHTTPTTINNNPNATTSDLNSFNSNSTFNSHSHSHSHSNSNSNNSTTTTTTESGFYVCGVNLQHRSKPIQFCVAAGGVIIFFVAYSSILESIFRNQEYKQFGYHLTLTLFICYSLFSAIELKMKGISLTKRSVPLSGYALIGFLTVASMALSNVALAYLNFPTQVIFKSCKLIPVMVGGIFIQNKVYSLLDFACAALMSVGLILFTLADVQVSPSFSTTGLLIISLALCADAAIGNVQEKYMKTYNCTNTEMIFFSYSIGSIYLIALTLVSGELVAGTKYAFEHPYETYGMGVLLSITGYLGVEYVLLLVRHFGALIAVAVTTFRKAFTMILSFVLFPKPFTWYYVFSSLLVFLGGFLNVYSKNPETVYEFLYKWTGIKLGAQAEKKARV